MAQEQQSKQDVPSIKDQTPGLPDVINNILKEVNDIRANQNPATQAANRAGADQGITANLPKVGIGDKESLPEKTGDNCLKLLSEKIFEKGSLEKAPRMLNRTENLILNGLNSAIRKGDLEGVQEMLHALAENPNSVQLVLDRFKRDMEAHHPLRSVNYVVGQDSEGSPYLRLSLSQRESDAKNSRWSRVTLDNAGVVTGERWDAPSKPSYLVDPGETLRSMNRQLEPLRPFVPIPYQIQRTSSEWHKK